MITFYSKYEVIHNDFLYATLCAKTYVNALHAKTRLFHTSDCVQKPYQYMITNGNVDFPYFHLYAKAVLVL